MLASQFQKPVRSLRLPPEDVERIVNRLVEEAAHATAGAERRTAVRHAFRCHNVVVDVTQPAGSSMCLLVETYSLSAGGLGFIHGGYLHIGSNCIVRLPTCDNAWKDLEGKVVRCRHLERGVHDVGLHWIGLTDPLDLVEFLGSTAPKARVLLVEDSEMTRKLAVHFLHRMNLDMSQAATCAEGRRLFDEQAWDVALIDLNLPDGDGRELVKEWRIKSPSTYLVAFTADTAAESRPSIMECGFDAFLEKPFTAEKIGKCLQDAMMEPILSNLSPDDESKLLISGYLKYLPGEMFRLSTSLDASNWVEARSLVRQIGTTGKSYGFDALADACTLVESVLMSNPVVEKNVRERFHQLVRLSRRCREG